MTSNSFDRAAAQLLGLAGQPVIGGDAPFEREEIEDVLVLFLFSVSELQRAPSSAAVELLTRFTRRHALADARSEEEFAQLVVAHFASHPPRLPLLKALTRVARELRLNLEAPAPDAAAGLLAQVKSSKPVTGEVSNQASLYQLMLNKKGRS